PVKGGLPPTLASLYKDPKLIEGGYPFAAEIFNSLQRGGIRPKTPAYQSVSIAMSNTSTRRPRPPPPAPPPPAAAAARHPPKAPPLPGGVDRHVEPLPPPAAAPAKFNQLRGQLQDAIESKGL